MANKVHEEVVGHKRRLSNETRNKGQATARARKDNQGLDLQACAKKVAAPRAKAAAAPAIGGGGGGAGGGDGEDVLADFPS